MSHNRQAFPQTSTSSSRVSSVTRVEHNTSNGRVTGTLRLRAEDAPSVDQDSTPARRIRWSEDVVDNEGMGKKSSKVCCIYHKARPVGESSSESESSDSDSDSSSSDSDQRSGDATSKRNCHHYHHNHRDGTQESPGRGRAGCRHSHDSRKTKRRKPSPNAYEKMPKNTKG
ncbi:phosphatase inhibitor-domain-containing protein [Aspergillus carlsbadensis]|nr:phosphatase inhibitor-domain-containing protein [Aspergillus carlsbadensis]